MVKLILYSPLTGCNAFISTNEIVLMKAEMVLRDRKRGEKERGDGKKTNQPTDRPISSCLKSRYCTVKRGSSGI